MHDWATIWADYHERIVAYFRRRIRCPFLVEDFAAETFAKALAADQSGNGPRSSVLAWLYRIAHNLLCDHYRHTKREPLGRQTSSLEDVDGWHPRVIYADNAESSYFAGEERQRIEWAINRLSPKQREIFLWHSDGLQLRQFSVLTGSPETAVKALHYRAIHGLREHLSEEAP